MHHAMIDLDARRRVLDLLRRYGWNSTSFQVLEPEFLYWFYDADACVAYVDTGSAWVVAGGPIAAEERIGEVAGAFADLAKKHGRRVAFFAVESRLLEALPLKSLAIGEQPSWDPQQWHERHRQHRSLREQLRRARAKGVRVERVPSQDLEPESPLRNGVEHLVARWVASRLMPAMAFLVELHPFVFASERRYYVARVGSEVRGVLVAVPVYLRRGWFFEDILRDPLAPNGTVEMLVDFAMRDVAESGAELVTLGLAPLAGSGRWLRMTRQAMRGFYNFEGLHAFKSKFRPDRWDPIFLAWPKQRFGLLALHDALSAFAHGRPFRFGIAALFRAPATVLTILASLLVPWLILLGSVDTSTWFPSASVHAAWVVFDGVVAAVLFGLARRWRQRLAILTAAATAFDTLATAAQIVVFNASRARHWLDSIVMTISLLAPAFATALLTGGILARRHVHGMAGRQAPRSV